MSLPPAKMVCSEFLMASANPDQPVSPGAAEGSSVAAGAPFSNLLSSRLDPQSAKGRAHSAGMQALLLALKQQEDTIRQGGGAKAVEAQHAKKRLTARERLALLLDAATDFLELGIFAAYGMYEEWGGAAAAGVIAGLGRVAGPAGDADRERCHGQSRRVLSHDGQRR